MASMYAIALDPARVTRPGWAAPKDRAKVKEQWDALNTSLKAAGYDPSARFSKANEAEAEIARLRDATGIDTLIAEPRTRVTMRVL